MSPAYDQEEELESPLLDIWQSSYPFGYWDNRIQKINTYNPQDQLEAVFTLLHLVDIFIHIFAARIRNPYQPWYMLIQETYRDDIDDTLGAFDVYDEEGEPFADLSLFNGEPDQLIGVKLLDEWKDKYDVLDFLATDFLGCPAEIDEETLTIEYIEDRDAYIAFVNGTIDFWRKHVLLLNDLKHGFRLLPFDWETFDTLITREFLRTSDIDLTELKSDYEDTYQSHVYFWRLEVGEGPSDEEYLELEPGDEIETGLRLVVYRIELQKCIQLARAVLRMIHNLFGRGGEHRVLELLEPLLDEEYDGIVEGEVATLTMVETFVSGELIYGIEDVDD